MSGGNEKLVQKWNIIKEQLIALCALNKLTVGNDEFRRLLSEDIELKSINSQIFNEICYYTLGIIDLEERDKLIQWPLINLKTNTKFRKGVSTIVDSFQEKYPWFNIKKLPGSYFMNPYGYLPKVIDFLLKLTNLAIQVALADPESLLMHSGDNLNYREINLMTEIISAAREEEEKLIRKNVFPLKEIEDAKNEICDKCICLRQENDDLQQQLNSLKKYAVTEHLFKDEKDIDIVGLKKIRDEKCSELNTINDELSKYHDLSKELLLKVKAFKNPLSLSFKEFGCDNSSPDITSATSRVCGDLCQFFQYLTLKQSTKEEEHDFYEKLKCLEEIMVKQNEAFQFFLHKIFPKDSE